MRLGFHVGRELDGRRVAIATALARAHDRVREIGIKSTPCMQIYVTGPQSSRELLTQDDKEALRKYTRKAPVVIHGAYIDVPWSGGNASIANIVKELRISDEVGAEGVVVHLSTRALDPDVVSTVLGRIAKHGPYKSTLWLETHTAKTSAATYETPEKIAALVDRVRKSEYPYPWGICIDSAHIHACGWTPSTWDETQEWIDRLPDAEYMLHLNDSSQVRGGGRDEHAPLRHGHIWGRYRDLPVEESGLFAFCEWAARNDMMVILERADAYINEDLELLRDLGF